MKPPPIIIAPLDGSELAERGLPYVSLLAKALRARVLLVTVWAGQNGGFARSLGRDWSDFRERANRYYQGYLGEVAAALAQGRSDVETHVDVGDPASKILGLVRRHQPSMLVTPTHGRSGLSRWWYGSVADRLIREAPVPTLVIGPKVLSARGAVKPIRRILVPLDGSPIAEEVLPHAVTLAETLKASLTLVRAVTPAIYLLPFPMPHADTVRIDKQILSRAQQYLDRRSARLKTRRPVKTLVARGQPAEALLALLEKQRFDLVVMTSHARRGLSRAVLGSVTDRVIHGPAPVFVVRPGQAAKPRRR